MSKSISLLLGAGFSAPKGYPIGQQLNNLLLTCDDGQMCFSPDGLLAISKDGLKPSLGYKTSFDLQFDFCRDLIKLFHERRGYFDYEEFYDFFIIEARNDASVQDLFQVSNGKYGAGVSLEDLMHGIRHIYSQLVAFFLKDSEGKSWYDDEGHMCGPIWTGYTGILNSLKCWGQEYIVNVHTLNHDLFFERLNMSDWLQGELCDGFEELGSPYFGALSVKNRTYKCRLQHYTGKYDKKFRLYKLHGSKDYGVYYNSKGTQAIPETYIKTRWGIGFSDLYKEAGDNNGELTYDHCWLNYHADFLTGTTSKIERYQEPLLFQKLFKIFRVNLSKADKLVIIGYRGRDSEVNKIILENFDYKNKPSFIVDPFPGKDIKKLQERIGAILIETHLDKVNYNEFE